MEATATAAGFPLTLSDPEAAATLGAIRAFLRQSTDLIDDPARPRGWTYRDPVVLNAQGRASISIADAIEGAAPQLGDLASRLAGRGGAFLDVGCGVGWLAVAMAQRYPALHVTGIDVLPEALTLAEANLAATDLAARITLREEDVRALEDRDRFDAAWLAGPFLPAEVLLEAVPVIRRALRPGGWALFGCYGGPPDPLSVSVSALRAVRSGGHPWTAVEAESLLRAGGFSEVRTVEHGRAAPVRLTVGRRAP